MNNTHMRTLLAGILILATHMLGAITEENVIYKNNRWLEHDAPTLTITHQPIGTLPGTHKIINFSEEDSILLKAGTYFNESSEQPSCKPIADVIDILKGGLSTKATLTFPQETDSIYLETIFKLEHDNSCKWTYPHLNVRMFSRQADTVPLVADLIKTVHLTFKQRNKGKILIGSIIGTIIFFGITGYATNRRG